MFKEAICDIYEKASVSDQVDAARKDILSFSPKDVKIPVTDTTLGPDSHFFVWFTNGLKEFMGITFLNVLGMKLFTCFGNIGNRDPKGKYHINIPGDAAAGKSHLIRILMEVVGPYFFKNVSNVSAKRYGVVSEYLRDMVICKDEGNVLNIATSEGDVSGFWRTLLSEGEADREVSQVDGKERKWIGIKVVNACQMLELTNIADSSAIRKAGEYAPVVTALASRKQNFNVMSYASNLESVQGSNYKASQLTETQRMLRDNFVKSSRLINLMRVEYWHLVKIGLVKRPAMDLYHLMSGLFYEELKKMDLKPTDVRMNIRQIDYCEQIVLLSAIYRLFFMPNGKFYNKLEKYETKMLLELIPICEEDHVIMTFGSFFSDYWAEEKDIILDHIRDTQKAQRADRPFVYSDGIKTGNFKSHVQLEDSANDQMNNNNSRFNPSDGNNNNNNNNNNEESKRKDAT